ncbi:MAG: hypothetical protein ABIE22_00080 [archaeon]
MNKRGAELTIGTLVVIVLAIIVLVVIALGFGTGWASLWSKISGYFSPVNVDATKQACAYACTTDATYDYCCRVREVKFTSDGDKVGMTCTDSRINPADCDITCNKKEDCKSLLCDASKLVEKDKCKVVDSDKTLDSNGNDISAGYVCCSELKTADNAATVSDCTETGGLKVNTVLPCMCGASKCEGTNSACDLANDACKAPTA